MPLIYKNIPPLYCREPEEIPVKNNLTDRITPSIYITNRKVILSYYQERRYKDGISK
jgi:hypothetical protein